VNGNDQDYQISWETDRCSVRVDMEGDIRFADDDRGIESMDRSARFEMEVRIGRDVRRVLVEREGGANVYRYWVGRDEQSWDARAQDWFATVLPELFRHTTFKAGPGVERFLSQGGPNAVFTEVEQIHSDHVAGIYLELLMERADLSTDELGRVLKVAGGQLESDHQLGELLIAFAEQEGLSEAHRRQFLDATATLESDHQMGQVLGRLLDEEGLANDLLLDVLRAVDDFDSDHNRGQIINVLIE
jgi:hypothetical protein